MKDDRPHLQHILECVVAIRNHTAGGEHEFRSDRKTQKAVLRELHELAESAQRVSSTLKARYGAVPWSAIAGFRNVIVHDYLGLNLDRVWSVVQNDLAPLEAAVQAMHDELHSPS